MNLDRNVANVGNRARMSEGGRATADPGALCRFPVADCYAVFQSTARTFPERPALPIEPPIALLKG